MTVFSGFWNILAAILSRPAPACFPSGLFTDSGVGTGCCSSAFRRWSCSRGCLCLQAHIRQGFPTALHPTHGVSHTSSPPPSGHQVGSQGSVTPQARVAGNTALQGWGVPLAASRPPGAPASTQVQLGPQWALRPARGWRRAGAYHGPQATALSKGRKGSPLLQRGDD